MTRGETMGILTILKATYPNFYKQMSENETTDIVNVWTMMFESENINIVKEAIKSLLCTLKFPPTIADVKEKIALITQPKQESELEVWGKVLNAIRNSLYNAKDCFDSLPANIQQLIGGPSQLKEWAMLESDVVNSVIQSNFMRSYKAKTAQNKEYSILPESTKTMISGITQKLLMDKV